MHHQFKSFAAVTFFIVGLFSASGARAQTFDVFKDSAAPPTKNFKDVIENDVINSTTYPYLTGTTGTLNTMTTGTTTLIGASDDDGVSAVTNIGFTFNFDGVNYTQFSVSTNGFLKLGSSAAVNVYDNEVFPSSISSSNLPMLAPYFEDLCTSSTGKVHYRIDGTTPNRRLTVEWLNMTRYNSGCTFGSARGTFQLQLFEARNDFTYVYGAIAVGTTGGGFSNPNYSVLVSSTTPTGTGSFASVNTTTQNVAYGTATNTNTAAVAAGRFYNFALPVTAAGVTVSGRVFDRGGKAVARAEVRFSDMNGNLRTAMTNQFGYYQFDEIEAGQTYVFQVLSKGATYTPQVVTANDNAADLNFYAQ